jgi:hypothetical protein
VRGARRARADDSVTFRSERLDRRVPPEGYTARRGQSGELLGETSCIPRLVGRRIDSAHEALAALRESRLDGDALVDGLDVTYNPERAQPLSRSGAFVELARSRVELQDAAFLLVVGEAGLRAQRPQAIT